MGLSLPSGCELCQSLVSEVLHTSQQTARAVGIWARRVNKGPAEIGPRVDRAPQPFGSPPFWDKLDHHPSSLPRAPSHRHSRGQLSKLAAAHTGKFLCPNPLLQAKERVPDPTSSGALRTPGIKTQMSPVLSWRSLAQAFPVCFCTVSG